MKARPEPPGWLAAARPLLAFGYLCCSHAATHFGSTRIAAFAVFLIVLLLLTQPLWQRRAWALSITAIAGLALWMLKDSARIGIALLLMPVIFLLLMAFLFGRTLRRGQVPVISRIVSALEGAPAAQLAPELARYTRGLTALWTAVFIVMAALNLGLAMMATPAGLLMRAGIAPPWPISDTQWSWFANWLNYGLVGGVFALEFMVRKRRFPGRYKNAADFFRRCASLGPAFWRDLFK